MTSDARHGSSPASRRGRRACIPSRFERLRHPPRVLGRRSAQLVRVIDPSPQAVTISPAGMLALGMVDQPHHAQRPILHRPKLHGSPPRQISERIDDAVKREAIKRPLKWQLEPRRQRHPARHLLHFGSPAAASALVSASLRAAVIRSSSIGFLRHVHQAVVDRDAEDPSLGGGADLDQPAARRRPRPRPCRDCPALSAVRPGRSAPSAMISSKLGISGLFRGWEIVKFGVGEGIEQRADHRLGRAPRRGPSPRPFLPAAGATARRPRR